MRILTFNRLIEFWTEHPESETVLRHWFKVSSKPKWMSFSDVPHTFAHADTFENKVIFAIGGNKYRLIAVVDYERERLFIRAVLMHSEYDEDKWKQDEFGDRLGPKKAESKRPKKRK